MSKHQFVVGVDEQGWAIAKWTAALKRAGYRSKTDLLASNAL